MKHLGIEPHISVAGKAYRLSRYSRKLQRQFLEWVDQRLGNPFVAVREVYPELPPKLGELLLKDAAEERRLRFSAQSTSVQEVWASPAGQVKLLGLLLAKHHPDLTPEQVEDLYIAANMERGPFYLWDAFLDATGRMPKSEYELEVDYLRSKGYLPPLKGPTRLEPENWLEIDKALIKHFGLRPWDIDELTVTEIMVFFASQAEDNKPADIKKLDTEAYLKALKRLTPAERLEFYEATSAS